MRGWGRFAGLLKGTEMLRGGKDRLSEEERERERKGEVTLKGCVCRWSKATLCLNVLCKMFSCCLTSQTYVTRRVEGENYRPNVRERPPPLSRTYITFLFLLMMTEGCVCSCVCASYMCCQNGQ